MNISKPHVQSSKCASVSQHFHILLNKLQKYNCVQFAQLPIKYMLLIKTDDVASWIVVA